MGSPSRVEDARKRPFMAQPILRGKALKTWMAGTSPAMTGGDARTIARISIVAVGAPLAPVMPALVAGIHVLPLRNEEDVSRDGWRFIRSSAGLLWKCPHRHRAHEYLDCGR